ncbi:MAG: helix-turn-helix domain-containing protein [Methanobacterium sp.]|jgi:transcriptional regulator with XRE-family HTH domain|uniref:helix-turn-helix domain-containing protein n=1 Tax=Methanobacterium sp. TaxID=2164 RepID=UPI003D940AA1
MTPNKEYIFSLVCKYDWSWAELARRMEISKTEVSRWISGKRKGGRKLFSGLIKAFPDEPIDKLFFLP